MKVTRIEREISHKIYLGGYETIEPTLRLSAELEEGDTVESALKELDAVIMPLYAREVLAEIRHVHRRRGDDVPASDKLPALLGSFKDIVREGT